MRALLIEIGLVLAVTIGVGVGYVLWGTPTNWYANVPDVAKLAPGPDNDLIRYGKDLVVNTPRYIGREGRRLQALVSKRTARHPAADPGAA